MMTLFAQFGMPTAGMGFGYSMTSILIFAGSMILSGLASFWIKRLFNKYAQFGLANGLTGAEIAQRILEANGLHDVPVRLTGGTLSDHYDPSNRSVNLSEAVYSGRSVSAAGVAAHEVGHALQHQKAYAPLHARSLLVKAQHIVSPIFMIAPFLGLFAGFIKGGPMAAVALMCVAMGVLMLFNLVTLPVEFDASRRAKIALNQLGLVRPEEGDGVSKVLWAAALTYVAAFLGSLAQFLQYVLPLIMNSRRSNEE
jgi:uncharacterized protein